jgi:hypothetical protein
MYMIVEKLSYEYDVSFCMSMSSVIIFVLFFLSFMHLNVDLMSHLSITRWLSHVLEGRTNSSTKVCCSIFLQNISNHEITC